MTNQILLNIWAIDDEEWDDGTEERLTFEHKDTYPNMSGKNEPNDGYHQFGVATADGHWLELRIPLDFAICIPTE